MWGPYLAHHRVLLDKQVEHAVDYFSQEMSRPNESGCSYCVILLTFDVARSDGKFDRGVCSVGMLQGMLRAM